MQFSEIRRFFFRLISRSAHARTSDSPASQVASRTAASALEFDPVWHGDHWQNLLSSPMDARRYVMEDWNAPTAIEWSNADPTAPAR
ncbi:MAG TPA: hypothetical protein VF573_06790 [Paraburkholderia sp.]|uniref:hypothetical protein n=1 Tax=Paraburkholderia sp. TaxID=1926495 RepID=UPI002ED198BA